MSIHAHIVHRYTETLTYSVDTLLYVGVTNVVGPISTRNPGMSLRSSRFQGSVRTVAGGGQGHRLPVWKPWSGRERLVGLTAPAIFDLISWLFYKWLCQQHKQVGRAHGATDSFSQSDNYVETGLRGGLGWRDLDASQKFNCTTSLFHAE